MSKLVAEVRAVLQLSCSCHVWGSLPKLCVNGDTEIKQHEEDEQSYSLDTQAVEI